MDRLRQMQIFVQVVESGSFSAAADRLRLPRSTVSTEVQALENRLQRRLLHRTTRQVVPTHDGLDFLPVARDLVAAVLAAEAMFLQPGDGAAGHLRVDMPSRMARRIVIPALPGFLRRHSGLSVELSANDGLTDLVANGVDCVLRVGTPSNSGLISRKLGDLAFVTCASPTYLARFGTPQAPGDLAGHRIVNYTSRFPARASLLTLTIDGARTDIPVASSMTVDSAEAYIAAALAGIGIIQVPAYDIRPFLASGALVLLMPDLAPAPQPLSFLFAERRNLPRGVRLFQDWLTETLAEAGVIAG